MIDKGTFSNKLDYDRAVAADTYKGVDPLTPKMAEPCLADDVSSIGSTPMTTGECRVLNCQYRNDKISGVAGVCLKRVVGVEEPAILDIASQRMLNRIEGKDPYWQQNKD